MRKLIAVTATVLTLGIAGTAIADGMRHFDRMADRLDLTEEQRDQVKELMSAKRDQMKDMRKENKESRKAFAQLNPNDANYEAEVQRFAELAASKASAMVKMRAEQRQEMSKILNEEQMEEYAEMKQKWGDRGGKHHKGKSCH